MSRWCLFFGGLVLLVCLSSAASAQSELVPSRTAVAGGATYVGVLATDSRAVDLDDLRGPGAALDATFGRASVGAAVSVFETETTVSVSGGYHLARDLAAQRVTTLGATAQSTDGKFDAISVLLSHAQRVAGRPGIAVIPSVGAGVVVPLEGGVDQNVALVATGSVTLLAGRGPVRGFLTPSFALGRGPVDSESVGVSLGLALSLVQP